MMTDFQLNLPSARMIPRRPKMRWIESSPTRLIKLKRGLVHRSLLYSLEKGYFSLIRFLVESGHGNIDERDQEGRTVLIYCTFINEDSWADSMAMLLLENGARIGDNDKRGLNALDYAIIKKRVILVRRFLGSLDVNLHQSVDFQGNTCLHHACSTGNLEMVQLIVQSMKKYSIDLTSKNKAGFTAYDIACQQNHVDCQNLLREEFQDQSKLTFLTTLVSQLINEPMNEEQQTVVHLPIKIQASPLISHPTGSFGSGLSILMSSSARRRRSINAVSLITNDPGNNNPKSLLTDPLESSSSTLRHNVSLDQKLLENVKLRSDFGRPKTTTRVSMTPRIPSSKNNWRDEFTKMYWQLQTFKTPSYRPSVYSLSQSEFLNNYNDRNVNSGSATKLDLAQQGSPSTSSSSLQKVLAQPRNNTASVKPVVKPKKVNFN